MCPANNDMKLTLNRLRLGVPGAVAGAENAVEQSFRLSVPMLAGLWGLYAIVRVLLLPADGAVVNGFSHDSGYISIVAERVRDGAGFTNPAHWLLFLNPPSLPMPFHNANPGYPALMAALSAALGVDVTYAGLLISALSSVLLGVAVFALVQRLSSDDRFAALCSVAVVFFPPLWRTSFGVLPDAMSTALCFGAIAVAVRVKTARGWAAVGLLFGLAWLGRSSSTLIVPGLLWWMLRTRTWRQFTTATLAFALGAVLVASPWLVHTYQTWGSPLRSDAGYYLLQDYLARSFDGDLSKFWRSLTPPPSLSQILASDAKGFALYTISGAPAMAFLLSAGLSEWNRLAGMLLFGLLALATVYSFRRWRSPELQAGVLMIAATVASLLIRGRSFEMRYFSIATVLLVLWMLLPLREYFSANGETPRRKLRLAIAAGCVLYAVAFLAAQDYRVFHEETRVSPKTAAYKDIAQQVANEFRNEPAIITELPYFYTHYTKRSAISPPNVGKPELLNFMSRYSARLLLLPTEELNYYYPGSAAALAPEIQPVKQIGAYTLLARGTAP